MAAREILVGIIPDSGNVRQKEGVCQAQVLNFVTTEDGDSFSVPICLGTVLQDSLEFRVLFRMGC